MLSFNANGVDIELTIGVADEFDTSSDASDSEDELVADAESEVNTVMRSVLIIAGIAAATSVYFFVF